jgi:hypothetical protein
LSVLAFKSLFSLSKRNSSKIKSNSVYDCKIPKKRYAKKLEFRSYIVRIRTIRFFASQFGKIIRFSNQFDGGCYSKVRVLSWRVQSSIPEFERPILRM